ncbi:MAG TPA: twin-arginine translocase TatA/TatE family subunit [Thermomicrobiales bacterium]|nr:twin-arginine translocase TatA/TatE family subunit [Thermomicrobiales bacterium]
MFGIGTPELIVILVVALIVFGPQRLPEIAAQVGKAIRDFRQMSSDLTGEFNRTLAFEEAPPAAALDPSPALSQETVTAQAWPEAGVTAAAGASGAPSGQNGHDAITTPLAVETIPVDVPAPAATETIWQEPIPANGHSDEGLLATKADPLAAVSLLEEPVRMLPVVPDGPATAAGPAAGAPADEMPDAPATSAPEPDVALVAATAEPAPAVATAEPVAALAPAAALAVAAPPADEPAAPDPAPVPATTAELDTPAAAMNGTAVFADWDTRAPRVRVDPGAEMTIREKIEAQIAAEAFRERRRRARYSRYGRLR